MRATPRPARRASRGAGRSSEGEDWHSFFPSGSLGPHKVKGDRVQQVGEIGTRRVFLTRFPDAGKAFRGEVLGLLQVADLPVHEAHEAVPIALKKLLEGA